MNNKPWAYVTSAWSADRSRAKRSAKRYCRKLYEAGYTPICPLLSLPEVIDTSNADEYKDYMDMSEDMLRRSRILVVCGSAVDDTVLTDIAIANRFHVASSTMRGVLGLLGFRRRHNGFVCPTDDGQVGTRTRGNRYSKRKRKLRELACAGRRVLRRDLQPLCRWYVGSQRTVCK